MRFEYVDGLPFLPIIFRCGNRELPKTNALVDTGSSVTILPHIFASMLGIEPDEKQCITPDIVGGGKEKIYRSSSPVNHIIQKHGFRDLCWESYVYFSLGQKIPLLGHKDCLHNFSITFYGNERALEILPQLK